jgi:hypothetical protein
MLALLVGMEAGTLRRFTLGRRRWRNIGTVVGNDRDTVERRFFESWVKGETLAPMSPPAQRPVSPAAPAQHGTTPVSDVIGLFPQPGAHR